MQRRRIGALRTATWKQVRWFRYADYRGYVGPMTVPDIPFPVSLFRFEPVLDPDHRFHIKHVIQGDPEAKRLERLERACAKKFPFRLRR